MERKLPNFYFTNRMMDNEFYISGSTNSGMVKNSSGLGIALGIVVIGLGLLLYGEYIHRSELVWGGGILALVGVAIQTYLIATRKK